MFLTFCSESGDKFFRRPQLRLLELLEDTCGVLNERGNVPLSDGVLKSRFALRFVSIVLFGAVSLFAHTVYTSSPWHGFQPKLAKLRKQSRLF
jgi:hypothetical protein